MFKDKWLNLCNEGIQKEENRDKMFLIEPVSPKVFFEEWLPPKLSPEQLKAIDSIFIKTEKGIAWSKDFQEYLLFWGEGSGKDFVCARILIYCAYWLMCLNNPQKYFNIADNEAIDLVNVSVNAPHARDVFFYKFTAALKAVKNPATGGNWFEEQGMDLRDKQDIQTTMVKFKKSIRAHSKHSEKYAGEGLNVLIAVFDEVGEFPVKKAKELYDALWHTETSRYGNQFKMFLISYMRDPQDFMCYRWDKTKDSKNVYRSLKKTWEVNPLKTQDDFKEAYKKDPEGSAMRYENINKRGSTNRFFRFETRIREYAKKRPAPFTDNPLHVNDLLQEALHTWFKPETVIRLDELLEIDRTKGLKEEVLKKEKELLELQHQDAKYYIHIDLAKANAEEGQDCGGFAMGHTYPINPFDEESERGVYIDLAIQLRVAEGELDFEMIRKFIYKLQERGFNIEKVTLDGWQSVDFIQRLKAKGIEAETLSIDKTMEPYDTFKAQLYSKQLDYYDYPVLLREAEELIISNGKVDHPAISRKRAIDEEVEKGSKDVSDAVAGVIFSALKGEPEKVTWFGI